VRRLETLLVVAALSALAVGMGACGSGGSDGSGASSSTVTETTTVGEPAPDSSSPPSSSGGGSAESWTMPDLTGKDLQTAQDSIQSLTNDAIFFTDSHDASGQGRHQILDRDWQVCDQDPEPGTEITPDTNIDFGVVRVDTEQCP
jgi:PASTA domain-containing protein